jgi:hypothetical protein
MDEETVLGWLGSIMLLGGTSGGLRAVRTREGYVAKMGSFSSPPSASLPEACAALRENMKAAITVGR